MDKKKQKLLFIVIGLVFLIAGAAAFLFFIKAFSKPQPPQFTPTKISDFKGPTPLPTYYQAVVAPTGSIDWELYKNEQLKFTIKHPKNIVIDERQTVKGKRTAMIFEEDLKKPLPNNIPMLFIVDTGNTSYDGLTVFKYADCQKPCKAETNNAHWIAINTSAYGVRNPNTTDIVNYFLTDNNLSGSVINMYVGNVKDQKDKEITEKIKTLEEVITTIEFQR